MGYKIKRKTYTLEFEDPEFEGLKVEVTSVPLGQFISLSRMADLANEKGDSEEAVKSTVSLFEAFAKALVSWNLEDEDGPVPATFEGLQTLDVESAMYLIRSWMTAVGGVSAPLGDASTDGETSQVLGTIPQEVL